RRLPDPLPLHDGRRGRRRPAPDRARLPAPSETRRAVMTGTAGKDADALCTVEFVQGSRIEREHLIERPPSGASLRIVQNGPPGTFVRFADGRRVPLPTDQIVSSEDNA